MAMRTANRFGAQTPQGAFSHNNINFPHRPQHQSSNSSGLPPPSVSNAFTSGNANPFAPTGNINGLAGGFGPPSYGNGTGLASQEVQDRFQNAIPHPGQGKKMRPGKGGSKSQQDLRIRDVYASNLNEEMNLLEQLVDKYPYISIDTEFPGIVARPMGAFTNKVDYHYQCLRCNVDLLKVVQLGISLFDENGDSPPTNLADIPDLSIPDYPSNLKQCPTTWQFNFKFCVEEDMYSQTSIDFLQDCGLDLKKHETDGIEPLIFGARFITSGLPYFNDVTWLSFHSGYDFAYVVKIMNQNELPEDETEYRRLLTIYFPRIYDVKFMIQHVQRTLTVNDQPLSETATSILSSLNQKGGLQSLADELNVRRIGTAHSAGSDALITGKVYWEVKRRIFGGTIDPDIYLGQIWGLSITGTPLFSPQSVGGFGPSVDGQANTPNLNGATIYNNNNSTQNQPQPPSTPASSNTGPASTPSQQRPDTAGNGGGLGSLTPGTGGGGVFGAFSRFGKG